MVREAYSIQGDIEKAEEDLLNVRASKAGRVEVTSKEENQPHVGGEQVVDKLSFLRNAF
jgi:hypothetical protein